MLAPLNSTMIAVALPSIMAEFDASVATAGWLVTAYLIAMASLQPIAGKLGDRFGRRRFILGGLGAFGVASIAAIASPTLPLLFVFRLLQAVAGAIALPNAAALVRDVVPAERRASRFGMVGAAVSLAAAAGPPLGGILVGYAGWRAIFYANVPFVIAALALGWWSIPRRRREAPRHQFDLGGALLLSAILVVAAGLATQGTQILPAAAIVVSTAIVIVAAGLFLWREARHPDPVLAPRLFRVRPFAGASAAIALSNLALYTTLLALPQLLTRREGWSSAAVGGALAPLFVASVICTPVGGYLADRVGRRWSAVVGLSMLTVGLAPLLLPIESIAPALLFGAFVVAGCGIGISSSPLQTSAVESVGGSDAGMAAGVFSMCRYFGSIAGSIALAALLGPVDGVPAFGAIFGMIVVAAALSAVASLTLRGRPSRSDG